MHRGLCFKHLSHILGYRVPELCVLVQPFVKGDKDRVVSFHITAELICGDRERYCVFQAFSLKGCRSEDILCVVVQKPDRHNFSVFCQGELHPGVYLHRYLARLKTAESERGGDAYAEHQGKACSQYRDPCAAVLFAAELCLRIGVRDQSVVDLSYCVKQFFSFHK